MGLGLPVLRKGVQFVLDHLESDEQNMVFTKC